MLKVAFIPWEEIRPCPIRGCCCLEVSKLPTEEELEERIIEHIDGQALAQAFERAARDMAVKKEGVENNE